MRRWVVVGVVALALIGLPMLVAARPAVRSALTAPELAARIVASYAVGWSGVVETRGTLQVPDTDTFATLSTLLGEDSTLRVWWRDPQLWRVDRLRTSGETATFHSAGSQIRWVFESRTATISPVSSVRLPDAVDLLPPTLARSLLRGAAEAELTRLPARRIAGTDAVGLRLAPAAAESTLAAIDVWADPQTGLPLRIELSGETDQRPVLTSTVVEWRLGDPGNADTVFRPADGIRIDYADSVDVAGAANAFSEVRLPDRLAGLDSRVSDTGAVRVYGTGPSTMLAVPLRGQVARPLRDRLRSGGTATETSTGVLAAVGPVGVLVTPFRGPGSSFLLTGTVTGETLRRAAVELGAS